MSFRQQFDTTQWRRLQFAPFLILSGVSGRYRDFALEETIVFEHWLDEAARAPGAFSREVLSSVSAEVAEITADYETYDVTIVRWAHGSRRPAGRPAGGGGAMPSAEP